LSATGGTPFPSASFSYPYTWSATGLPLGLRISYFTGEITGPPGVAQTYSPTVTVTDFDGNTASKTFQVAIAANPKLNSNTVVQNAYYSMLADYWAKIATLDYRAAEACATLAPEQPYLAPLCAGLLLKAAATMYLANLYWDKVLDPVDNNYTVIAIPNPPQLTIPAPDPSWTAAQLAAYNSLLAVMRTEEQIIGLSTAEITSVNRAQGANLAGIAYWVQQQLAAQQQYSIQEAYDLQLLLSQATQLQSAYSASGFPDFSVTASQATQFELGIAANGLPSDLQQQLVTLGIDTEGLKLVQQALSSFDPNTVSGDILQSFVPPSGVATTFQQLASSLTSGATLLKGSQISTTASGLAYSRVSKTFNGTVTITNVSGATINGPFQIIFELLTSGVTLQNSSNAFGGFPYLTVPGNLAPGQSAKANVQFANPSDVKVNFVPIIYSGSFN
jgi:hypothetical protein